MGNHVTASDAIVDGVRTLDDLITRAATRWPDKTAWIFDQTGERLTFADIDRRTATLTHLLHTSGIEPGDTVGVMADNVPDFPLAWLAIARMGATTVPLNPSYGRMDISHVVTNAGCRVVLAQDTHRARISDLLGNLDTPPDVVDLSDLVKKTVTTTPGTAVSSAVDSPANIQFTSGTTGTPKGCVLGHDYWIWISKTLVEDFPALSESDTVLTAQPFFYIDPQWNVTSCMLAGATLVILDGFHPSTFWQKVRDYDVTFFYCLGLMPTLLLKIPEHVDDKNHRVRAVVASAIPPTIHHQLEARWGVKWFEAFGMTETGADIYVTPDIHAATVGEGALGLPRPHRRAEIRRPDGTACATGEIGELFLSGPGMMREYFHNPEATARAITDGWFATGDLVSADDNGIIFFRGRNKDMIRRSGENIAAVEVEAAISHHSDVSSVAVMGVPDELRGEEVVALFVPRDASVVDNTDATQQLVGSVRDALVDQLAPFKIPRYWLVVAGLPRGASERVQKNHIDIAALWPKVMDTTVKTSEGR